MMTAPPQRRSTLSRALLACAAGCICTYFGKGASFLGPVSGPGSQDDASKVSRAEALRWLPGLAIAGGAAPSRGDSGVTKAWVTSASGDEDTIHTGGVEWEDVKVGGGPSPVPGDMIGINYKITCLVNEREVTIEDTKGNAKDFRFGVGQLIFGMDEGILGMRSGGVRKMKIPGKLAFASKAIPAAPGRPTVPPYTPVAVTVSLDFLPGKDSVYEYGKADSDDAPDPA
eukprot:TRINITY_DN97054_c0_g1_i1.p1 TRINITY_DN97054_c0_g1~~TRINITY_DN97054_c0_g1_i1.p1  ORF type:complete len:228 (-),score=44.01 TRINITY_DN97054_c0_g1_i1:194-877(-)